jgi:hypothetical protein
LFVIALVCFATPARADGTSSAAAELLFRQGRVLFEQERFAEACDHFRRSQELDPGVGTLINLGDCYKHLGKTASAWVAYNKAVALAKSRSDDRRSTIAHDEARELEPMLPRIQIKFAGTTPGISILLNGEAIDPSTFATPIPVDPGEVTFEASAPGRKKFYTTVEIAAGVTKTITVPALESTTPEGNPLATGLEIGGGVALGASVIFGTIALLRWSSVENACPQRHCPNQKTLTAQTPAASSAMTFAHISTVTAVLGVVGLGAGLYLDFGRSKNVAVGLDGPTVAIRARWP